MRGPASWKDRRLRASRLSKERPHSAELLTFYVKLLDIQEALYSSADSWKCPSTVRAPIDALPRLRLERLPAEGLLPRFRDFLSDVSAIATDVLAGIARSLQSSSGAAQAHLLRDFLSGKSPDNLPTTFFPRAYLQPLVRAIAERCDTPTGDDMRTICPMCGWAPQVSVIRDEADIKGRRLLICSLCNQWWAIRRALCANCHESHTDRLIYHECDAIDFIRIEECTSCGHYIKSVDLRKNGNAVPDVEDVGSVELDLWAQERGLSKIQRNVLGL